MEAGNAESTCHAIPPSVMAAVDGYMEAGKAESTCNTEAFGDHMRFADRSGYAPARIHPDIIPTQLTEFAKLESGAWDRDEVAAATDMMIDFFKSEGLEFDFLSDTEAWEGFYEGGERLLEGMPMNTSPGIGFAELLPKGRRTKRDLMEKAPKFVADVLKLDEESLKTTCPLLFIIKQNPKIELRDVPRVVAKKTRLYDAGPLPYTFRTRKLLGRFLGKMYKLAKSLKFFQCAGMDVFRGKWNQFVKFLYKASHGRLGAFDISKYDKNMSFCFMFLYAYVLTALCTNDDRYLIMRHEWRMMFSPIYLAMTGILYQPTCMNHSGRADTVILNGFVNLFVMFMGWVRNTPREKWHYQCFFEHIQPRVIGDDNLSFYNHTSPVTFEQMLQAYNSFGWATTLEGEPGGPEGVAFAGRRFVFNKFADQWWPVLPRGRILAILEWIKRGRNEEQRVSRWSAGAVYGFPLMFMDHNGRADPAFWIIWEGFQNKNRDYVKLTGNKAYTISLKDIYSLYAGHAVSESIISTYYHDYVNTCKEEQILEEETRGHQKGGRA